MGRRSFQIILLAGFLLAIAVPKANAVPAWSRAGNVKCTACHVTPTWQLNSDGLEFLRNGHRGGPDEIDQAAMKWDNYFSFVWKFRAFQTETERARPNNQFEQHSFSVYTGGALSERFSYFTEMYFSENTGTTSATTVGNYDGDGARKKLAEAFLQYNQPMGGEDFIAFRVGEILPEIIHTFGAGARSIEDRAMVLNSTAHSANPYKPFTRAFGFDAKYNSEHFELGAGVLNGATKYTNTVDPNNAKDLYLSALGILDANGSSLGLFQYNGTYSIYATQDDPSTAWQYDNKFSKTGVLGRYIAETWRVVAAYFAGNDESATAAPYTDKTKIESVGYYALADYNFSDDLGIFARYDFLDPAKSTDDNETNQTTAGVNGMLFMAKETGGRWQIELSEKNAKSNATTSTKTQKALAQITWGF